MHLANRLKRPSYLDGVRGMFAYDSKSIDDCPIRGRRSRGDGSCSYIPSSSSIHHDVVVAGRKCS